MGKTYSNTSPWDFCDTRCGVDPNTEWDTVGDKHSRDWPFGGFPPVRKPEIQEMAIKVDGQTRYIYFAWLDGKWTDLAPHGNRIPS